MLDEYGCKKMRISDDEKFTDRKYKFNGVVIGALLLVGAYLLEHWEQIAEWF